MPSEHCGGRQRFTPLASGPQWPREQVNCVLAGSHFAPVFKLAEVICTVVWSLPRMSRRPPAGSGPNVESCVPKKLSQAVSAWPHAEAIATSPLITCSETDTTGPSNGSESQVPSLVKKLLHQLM